MYIDFSPLATYRKSRMLSAVLGSYINLAILRHGARSFFLAYGKDGDERPDEATGTKVERRTTL
jgi:hypothetical protein